MRLTKRNFVFASLLLIAVATGVLWVTLWGWPIIRDREYRQLVAGFQQAQLRDNLRRGDQDSGWDFQVELPDEETYVRVQAYPHMAVAKVKYGNESDFRSLYAYVDYSNPLQIRTNGEILYVHWEETLVGTKHWLLAYDLAARREIARRRIDADDLTPVP
jgi:hypothetical protein